MVRKILRVVLAGIFLAAGGSKILEPMLFQAVIQSYFAMPASLALVMAIVVPWIEIMAALSLLFNWKTLYSSGLIAGMSLFFFGLMAINYGKELPFGCGCFGFNGAELVSIYHVARELIIFSLAAMLFYMTKNGERKEEKNQSI